MTTAPAPLFAEGTHVSYVRNFDGFVVRGKVLAVRDGGDWPKDKHCPYIYGLAVAPEYGGWRTLCECRLRSP